MKTRTLKMTGAMAIFAILMAAQSVSAYYNPSTGRWLNRDPIGETAFTSITSDMIHDNNQNEYADYQFVNNDSVINIDYLGCKICSCGYYPPDNLDTTHIAKDGVGYHYTLKLCSFSHIGDHATYTLLPVGCSKDTFGSYFIPDWCWDCKKRHCDVTVCYLCTRGTDPGSYKGKPVWRLVYYTMSDCHKQWRRLYANGEQTQYDS